jgi:S-adenosyl-L-methionine hydrolase (adenosine-forming)
VTLRVGSGAPKTARYARTFADVSPGELLLYEDAQRRLAVAVSHGSAVDQLGVAIDDELRIRPA